MTPITPLDYTIKSLKLRNLKAQYRNHYSTPKLLKFLAAPDFYVMEKNCETIKKDRTTMVTVERHLIKKCPIVIKRFNTKNAWHALRRTIRQSRAENCWLQAINLERLGIAIAPPVAFIQEYLGPGLKGCSWYISEFVDGPSCLDQLQAGSLGENDEVMEQIVKTLNFLWKNYISHGDTKGSNFLLAESRAIVLDLDGMKQHRNAKDAEPFIHKDVERFLRNWHSNPHLFELAQKKLRPTGFS